jgi:hypothetical protein
MIQTSEFKNLKIILIIRFLKLSRLNKDLKVKNEELNRVKEDYEKVLKTLKDREKDFENEIFHNSQNKLSKFPLIKKNSL